LTKTKHVMHQL